MKMDSTAPHERAVLRLARRRGLLRSRDVVALGIPTVVLTRLARAGKLERTGRGIYALAGRPSSANRSLAEVSLRAPRGVICLLSALRVTRNRNAGAVRGLAGAAGRRFATAARHPRDPRGPHVTSVADRWGRHHQGRRRHASPSSTPPRPSPTASSFATRSGSMLHWRHCATDGVSARSASMIAGKYGRLNRVANVMRPYLESLT